MQIQENKSEKKQQVITRTKRFAIKYEQTNTTRNRTGDRGGEEKTVGSMARSSKNSYGGGKIGERVGGEKKEEGRRSGQAEGTGMSLQIKSDGMQPRQ